MGKAKSDKQCFWRDAGLPFVELRRVDDGRSVCYERHSHDTFSIGIVKGGRSTYWNRGKTHETGKGSVVVLNPEDVHGCNPVPGGGWKLMPMPPGGLRCFPTPSAIVQCCIPACKALPIH